MCVVCGVCSVWCVMCVVCVGRHVFLCLITVGVADQGVAEGHVVVMAHQLSDLMAHPCVGNQLSPFIRVAFTPCGHVYLCGKCQLWHPSGRTTVEPVHGGGGGEGGTLPLTALHHGERERHSTDSSW